LDRPGKGHSRGLFLDAEHQLRQPLNALSLLIGELRQGPDQNELAVIADDMRYAVTLSHAWLESLANVERARQGLLSFQVEDVSLRALFDRLREDFTPHFAELGLTLKVAPTRAVVRADPAALRSLLAILLDNAAKFTPEGRIEIRASIEDDELQCEVRDTGIGICPDDQQFIFDEFFQVDVASSPTYTGAGLGLALVRDMIALLDGEVAVTSDVGRGTAVTFRIPVQVIG